MFKSVQKQSESSLSVDMTPLIDVVFILLLFFLVTTTFVKETGISVDRPTAATAQHLSADSLRVAIAPTGATYTEGRRVELGELRGLVKDAVARDEQTRVIVIPDESVASGRLIEVMDLARAAGATRVSVATQARGGPTRGR